MLKRIMATKHLEWNEKQSQFKLVPSTIYRAAVERNLMGHFTEGTGFAQFT
jgi:hypothetical protein